jgi:hypothetical protein
MSLTVEQYAIDLACDAIESCAEDDLNEDGKIAESEHEAALDLAMAIAKAIRKHPQVVLELVGRGA